MKKLFVFGSEKKLKKLKIIILKVLRGQCYKTFLFTLFFRTPEWADKVLRKWAAVVAQLVERLLPTPEILGSNPVIS